MKCFDKMIDSNEYVSKGVQMLFIHNMEYELKTYKNIPCLKHLAVQKGVAYLLEKKHYDNMFV